MSSFGSATPEPTAYTDAANEEPKPIQGYLLKQSPNRFRQCGLGLQTRFVTVRAGRVYWSHHSACTPSGVPSSPQGYIDLVVNECDVVDEDDSRFALCPKGGHWSDGSFTGHNLGRVFHFDAARSDRCKGEWVDAFTKHVDYASAVRGSLLRSKGHSVPSPAKEAPARHVTFADAPADVCDGATSEDAGAPGNRSRARTAFELDVADDDEEHSRDSIMSATMSGDRIVRMWTEDARTHTSSTGGT